MLLRLCLAPLLVLGACSTCAPRAPEPGLPFVVFTGACDASGAVQLTERTFAVADDEDNVLRVYDAVSAGAALAAHDLSESLGLPRKRKGEAPELDLEAGTRLGPLAYWITSHGRSRSGKPKPERARFFATAIDAATSALRVVAPGYPELVRDLLEDARYAALGLGAASQLPPKEGGGLNIEGLTSRADGGLFIGFRSPIPAGRALIAPLSNPEAVVRGARAAFGEPVLLDLGGRGVRGLSRYGADRYLVLAGDAASAARAALYVWDGAQRLEEVAAPELSAFNPEAFFTPTEGGRILLLSDDGTLPIEGVPCKRLAQREAKRFRGLWLARERIEGAAR